MSESLQSPLALLDRIDRAERELHACTQAALQLARRMVEAAEVGKADDDDWRRMPGAKDRCLISHWSRSSLNRHIAAGRVRRKTLGGSVFYAGADVRRLLNS